MVILDANIILRYLLKDNEKLSAEATRIVHRGDACVTLEVLAEVVYVLMGLYQMSRKETAEYIRLFLGMVNAQDMDVIKTATETFEEKNLDFVDCVLYAYLVTKNWKIATFDKKLRRLLEAWEET